MTSHMITIIAYLALGIGIAGPTTVLIFTKTATLEKMLTKYLTHAGVVFIIEHRRLIESYLILFATFIFACAVDHYVNDHAAHFAPWFVHFSADFEATVSGITAVLFAIGPVGAIWVSIIKGWFRKGDL